MINARISYRSILNFVLFLIFPFSVVIDIYNGYGINSEGGSSPLALGYKGLLMIVCLVACFSGKTFAKGRGCILLFLFFFLIEFLYWTIADSYFNLGAELKFLLKFIFPYIVLAFLFRFENYIENRRFIKLITYYPVISALSIIFFQIIGIGVSTYGDGLGAKGLFTAGNDIGLILLTGNCVLCYLYTETFHAKYLFAIIAISAADIMLGTMAGMGGTIVVLLFLFFKMIFTRHRVISAWRKLIGFFVLSVVVISALTISINFVANSNYLLSKADALLEGDSRSGLKDAAVFVLSKYGICDWTLGRGYTDFGRSVAIQVGQMEGGGSRLTEMDFHDLLGYYGILVGGSVIMFSIYVFAISLKKFFKTKDNFSYWSVIALALFIGHSALAGHGYTSPQTSLEYVAIAFLAIRDARNDWDPNLMENSQKG